MWKGTILELGDTQTGLKQNEIAWTTGYLNSPIKFTM